MINTKILEGSSCFIKILDTIPSKFDILKFCEMDKERYPYLLESSAKGNEIARFSITFFKPKRVLEKRKENSDQKFLKDLDKLFLSKRVAQKVPNSALKLNIPFLGGWFVYLGYELVKEIESKILIPDSPFQIPTAFVDRVNSSIIFDKLENRLYFISDKSNAEIMEMYADYEKIFDNTKEIEKKKTWKIKLSRKETALHHIQGVKKCIEHIFSGEIFQANFSRLWEFETEESLSDVEIYKNLRASNPSPFGGLVSIDEGAIISSSPERLIQVQKTKIQTRPIAGTRPRGYSGLTDVALSKELIDSNKERAEHLMLVDLERNDISRVCEPGSVKVDEMMVIESYAHVHHIVSNVSGKLIKNITPGKILSAVFPGGTITGCPKVRCIEILGDLEKIGRGPYTGSFGYICHSGDMDFNILIRSIIRTKDKLYVRAGGGIVADSQPEKETLETEAKANGMLKALNLINK